MKFHTALLLAAAAVTARASAVDASDFADLDSFLANVPTAAVLAAQSALAAGVQPTTTAATPAESSAAAALASADDGLPSEAEIDVLIASAAAQFGSVGDLTARREPQPRTVDAAAAAAATLALQGLVQAAAAANAAVAAAATGNLTAVAAPTASPTGSVVAGNGSAAAGNEVWTAAAAREALSGLAVAGVVAAYFL
ncbi:hypothetical protein A9K55_006874 [Cordyceps militaris]|uniref:Uncharacterized protein n=1 Tax=Cordyceps militaris TaxID=73501 RepID=A0A2H4SA02_CORMI|nr:hypothetical protein A9K55_006874 [Cordyceps militaris]